MGNQTRWISEDARRIENDYDAENDLIPGAPEVTHTDIELLRMIKRLVIVIDALEEKIETLQEHLSK